MPSAQTPVAVVSVYKKRSQDEKKALLRAELEARVAGPENAKVAGVQDDKNPMPEKRKGTPKKRDKVSVSDKAQDTAEKEEKKPLPPIIKQPWVADLNKCPFTKLPDGKYSSQRTFPPGRPFRENFH